MNELNYEERAAIYSSAIKQFGAETQITVAIEEMSELTKELCKLRRADGQLFNLAEEIADVTIMLEQMRLLFNVNEQVCDIMDFKLRRLVKRIELAKAEALR